MEDVCGTCDDDPTNDCVLTDCAGTLGGSAVLDDCGVCDEDDSNDNTTCQQDCAGTWNGAATVDNCGTCDDDPANDCVQDCAGTWGGSAMTDDAGDCGYWTRETTLDCWHPVSANYVCHAGMTSQEECFEICLEEPGCDAIYQFKYANPSDSRSCFLFNQTECYDTGQMQPEINIVGWERGYGCPLKKTMRRTQPKTKTTKQPFQRPAISVFSVISIHSAQAVQTMLLPALNRVSTTQVRRRSRAAVAVMKEP